jgi:TfoX C-terminal domain
MGTAIEKTPNIGPTLASHLTVVGIATLEDLVELGDAEAYARLVEKFPEDANAQTRLELAGAVRSVRWSTLPIALRRELAADTLAKRRKPL